MKLSTNTAQYQTNIPSAAEFGIQQEDLSHIAGILRSDIYPDPIKAIIREYSTNAYDANVEAGRQDTPINVYLPTQGSPHLVIRDYGHGLSDEEVCNTYVKYGASTKRNSNDYTGCLGIGSKSAFAYGESFTITSYTQDRITKWEASIDESQVGRISMLSEKENEYRGVETGVEISIKVKKSDIDDFHIKAKRFFPYWKTKPECNIDIKNLDIFEESNDWIVLQNTQGRWSGGSASIVMGNIQYPIDVNEFKGNDAHSLLSNANVLFKAPLGCVDIAANRETVRYTDRTKNSIIAMANNMMNDLTKALTKDIAQAPTRLQASIQSHKYDDELWSIANNLKQNANWNSMPLLLDIKFGHGVVEHYKKHMWRNDEYKNYKNNDVTSATLSVNTHLTVWDSDTIAQSNATRRIRTLQHEKGNNKNDKFFVIEKKHLDLVKPKLEPADYTDLDNVEPMPANRTIIASSDGKKTKKIRINVCHLKPSNLKSSRITDESEPKATADGQFIYVPLDRFDWLDKGDLLANLSLFQLAIKTLSKGLNDDDTEFEMPVIHGVKKHHLNKLDSSWITLDEYIKDLWQQWTQKFPILANESRMGLAKKNHTYDNKWNAYSILQWCNNPEVSKCAKYQHLQDHTRTWQDRYEVINAIILLGIEKRSEEYEPMLNKLNAKYPLLQFLNTDWRTQNNDARQQEQAKEIDIYINAKNQQS